MEVLVMTVVKKETRGTIVWLHDASGVEAPQALSGDVVFLIFFSQCPMFKQTQSSGQSTQVLTSLATLVILLTV